MTTVLRTTTFVAFTAALTDLLTEIAVATGNTLQVVGWRGQRAHVPPSAWFDFKPTQTQTKGAGLRIEDTLAVELWLTAAPSESEGSELEGLAALVDIALPIVDAAINRTESRTRFAVDHIDRPGFSFQNARTATSEGDPGDLLALVIPLSVRWTATAC